jgi:hypothetical protein
MNKPDPDITYSELKNRLQALIYKNLEAHKARLAVSGPHAVPPPPNRNLTGAVESSPRPCSTDNEDCRVAAQSRIDGSARVAGIL